MRHKESNNLTSHLIEFEFSLMVNNRLQYLGDRIFHFDR